MTRSSASYDLSSPTQRLSNIKGHMAGVTPTSFDKENVPQAPEDPLFGLMAAYRKDESPKKVDLGIGAYRDNNAKPWVLPVVQKVTPMFQSQEMHENSNILSRPTRFSGGTQTLTMNIFP